MDLAINATRLLNDLDTLSAIGRTHDGGVTRTALSEVDVAGRSWFRNHIEAAGLRYCIDGAGNQSAVLGGTDPTAKTLLLGSHLDTVPNGGRFDGALGVLAALEVLRTVQEHGLQLPIHLEAISFTDEEGSVFSMLGSLSVAGLLSAADLSASSNRLQAGLTRIGQSMQTVLTAKRARAQLAGYLELHIEQGQRLEQAQIPIGIVHAIVGTRSFWLTFTGQAGHAGSTPMRQRADALQGAACFVQQAYALVIRDFDPGVMNCGQIELKPSAFNIIPATVRLALEFRHADEHILDEMEHQLLALAERCANTMGLSLMIESLKQHSAAIMQPQFVKAIETAAKSLGLPSMLMLSYAGHDAQNISQITPSAMIFVPSVNGISHNPNEYTNPKDIVNGANVLLRTALEIVEQHATGSN